jgi:hypothetical protein
MTICDGRGEASRGMIIGTLRRREHYPEEFMGSFGHGVEQVLLHFVLAPDNHCHSLLLLFKFSGWRRRGVILLVVMKGGWIAVDMPEVLGIGRQSRACRATGGVEGGMKRLAPLDGATATVDVITFTRTTVVLTHVYRVSSSLSIDLFSSWRCLVSRCSIRPKLNFGHTASVVFALAQWLKHANISLEPSITFEILVLYI